MKPMRPTPKLRTLCLLTLIAVFIFSISCQDQGANGVATGCSGANSISADSSIPGNPSMQGPVPLPVTIAKAVPGVDASSVGFSPLSNQRVSDSLFATTDTGAPFGTLTWQLENGVCGNSAVLAANTVIKVVTSHPDT